MSLASELHDLALKNQDKNVMAEEQLALYNEFIAKAKEQATFGKLEYVHQFPLDDDKLKYNRYYQELFYNFQTNFVVVKELLQNDGFIIDTNIYKPDMGFTTPYVKISW